MLTSIFKIIIFVFTFFLFISCSKSSEDSSLTLPQVTYKNFAILGPISGADVTIELVDSNETLCSTKTNALVTPTSRLKWGSYSVGSFDVSFNEPLNQGSWLYLEVKNGTDIDKNDNGIVDDIPTTNSGSLKLYTQVKDFNSSTVVVNAFTTIAALIYEENSTLTLEESLNSFAQKVFTISVDEFSGVDYRDLYGYIPNYTTDRVLKNSYIYDNLYKFGFMDALLADENLTELLYSDSDGDSLTFLEELLFNSNPNLSDTDSDSLNDKQELLLGLNPSSADSDGDGLSDADEINIHSTDALKADSDDDYLPDALEIAKGSDPLNGDENNNGIMDGLDDDPFYMYQWYIKSLGNDIVNTAGVSTIVGNDLNILETYHYVVGSKGSEKVTIQVVDSGVEVAHEDLEVDTTLSLNAVNHTNDPSPTKGVTSDPYSPADIGHGSAVAGIIAAKTNNGLGVRGLAPYAKIAGSNWLESESTEELEKVWYSEINSDAILVSNNSWGAYVLEDYAYEEILALATSELRGTKGRVFTFASGNFRKDFGNANLSYLSNNPYAITVASLNHKDSYSIYSNPGSNVLVSAYGGEYYYDAPTIMTTLLMGKSYYQSELIGKEGSITVDEDSARNYTYVMNGTSAATPMVSAIIALTLEACPQLSYRDIRWLIAHTSKKIDITNKTWVQNTAGLWHSIDYGYGKINALGMVEDCRSQYFRTLPPLQKEAVSKIGLSTVIPDTNSSVITPITFLKEMQVEWLGLTLQIDHPFAGDLEINLISPQGTKTTIMTLTETHYNAYKEGFRFSSVAFIDENASGVWSVEVIDRLSGDFGTLQSIKLEIYGYEK